MELAWLVSPYSYTARPSKLHKRLQYRLLFEILVDLRFLHPNGAKNSLGWLGALADPDPPDPFKRSTEVIPSFRISGLLFRIPDSGFLILGKPLQKKLRQAAKVQKVYET